MKKATVLLILLLLALGGYHGLAWYDNQFRFGRMRETPAVRPHEEPLLIMEKGVVPTDGGEAALRAAPAGGLVSPLADNLSFHIEQGKKLYRTYCAQCHGRSLDGNGTVGQSFHPLPTDLTGPTVQAMSSGQIFKEISYGKPGGRQPALATTISIHHRWQIVAYLKSLSDPAQKDHENRNPKL